MGTALAGARDAIEHTDRRNRRSSGQPCPHALPCVLVPQPAVDPRDPDSRLLWIFVLGLCCTPGPFGALTSVESRGTGVDDLLFYVGIECLVLAGLVAGIFKIARTPTYPSDRWAASAYLVLGVILVCMGIGGIANGAPYIEAKTGTPDWGYRVDGIIHAALGAALLCLFVREVRLRRRARLDLEDSPA